MAVGTMREAVAGTRVRSGGEGGGDGGGGEGEGGGGEGGGGGGGEGGGGGGRMVVVVVEDLGKMSPSTRSAAVHNHWRNNGILPRLRWCTRSMPRTIVV